MPSLRLQDERNKFSVETSFFWLRSNSALLTSRQLCLRFSDRNIDARWVCWKDFYQIFGRVSILLPKPDNVIKRTFQTILRLWPQTFCGWSLCTVLSCKHSSSQATNAKATNIYSQFSNWCHKRVYLDCSFKSLVRGDHIKNIENLTRNKKSECEWQTLKDIHWNHTWYLSFFLHRQNFWRIKFTPKFTQ